MTRSLICCASSLLALYLTTTSPARAHDIDTHAPTLPHGGERRAPDAFVAKAVPIAPRRQLTETQFQTHPQRLDFSADPIGVDRDVDSLLQRYSLSGDDTLLEQARAQLQTLPQPHDPTVQLQAAWLAQAEHDFEEALRLARGVTERQPHNGQAWLLQAAVATVRGDAAMARRACTQVSTTVSPSVGIACRARLASSAGEQTRRLHQLSALHSTYRDERLRAWALSVEGDLATALGELDSAEALYRESLSIRPALQTRAALIDLLLQQQRYTSALELTDSIHNAPAMAIRRLLALAGQGADIDSQLRRMDTTFRQWISTGDLRHAREMARFYLELQPEPELAYRMAEANLRLQREPEDMELLRKAQFSF